MIIQGADRLRAGWTWVVWVGGRVAGCDGRLVGVLIRENPLHVHARPIARNMSASGINRRVVFLFMNSILPPDYHAF
jgi:hypothetical protein